MVTEIVYEGILTYLLEDLKQKDVYLNSAQGLIVEHYSLFMKEVIEEVFKCLL